MWVCIYIEGEYSVEKKVGAGEGWEERGEEEIRSGKEYRSALEYVLDAKVGRYRLKNTKTKEITCISSCFEKILGWIGGNAPELLESVSYELGIGGYIKSYVSKENVVVLCAEGFQVYRMLGSGAGGAGGGKKKEDGGDIGAPAKDESKIRYDEIRKIEERGNIRVETEKEVAEVQNFSVLYMELLSMSLKQISGDNLSEKLFYQCVTERICSTIPIYRQEVRTILLTEKETILLTEDFMIFKNGTEYVAIPLDMVRKVEVVKGWSTQVSVRDANQREFLFRVSPALTQEESEEFLMHAGREERGFKKAYFSVLLDVFAENRSVLSPKRIDPSLKEGAEGAKCSETDLDGSDRKNEGNTVGKGFREKFQIRRANRAGDRSVLKSINETGEYRMYIHVVEGEGSEIELSERERPFFWMSLFCIGGMCVDSDLYSECVARIGKTECGTLLQIEKDVERASREQYTEEEQKTLKKILLAFSVAGCGEYLQSHALIAGVLFRVLGEHGTFLALVHIFTRILPGYVGAEIYGMKRDVSVFLVLVRESFPGLSQNLAEKEIDLEILVAPWFLSLFTTVFSREHIERVFDCISQGGACFVFRLCLALLERMYVQISRSQQSGSVLKASRGYLFSDGAVPSVDEKEFSLLLSRALNNRSFGIDRIISERQRYEICNRR